ncbi:hypothetical protein EV361DRAFT_975506 [Lentinula raphanica]|nr:hypothetical protein EV361DRAFT_873650 [Lentinula raphanica]KAJ3964915.1 hypothetical protein EV361DRAFT_975506 [Lentinula raphanica]
MRKIYINTYQCTLHHYEYIQWLQQWQDKYEVLLDSRPWVQSLNSLSHYLTEFQYSKVDELDVPGQYTKDKDNNQNFIKIQKLVVAGSASPSMAVKILTFPSLYNSLTIEPSVMRREFLKVFSQKKETQKRNLNFHLPAAVSSALEIDEHSVKKLVWEWKQSFNKTDYLALKKNVIDEISSKMVLDDVLNRLISNLYMIHTMDGPSLLCFMTFVFFMLSHQPARFVVSHSTGQVAMTELLAGMAMKTPIFAGSCSYSL